VFEPTTGIIAPLAMIPVLPSRLRKCNKAFERLGVTQQLREQANLGLNLAQARYNLGLGSIVELGQAELQKTEADIADTDAHYQYRLTRLVVAYTIGAPK
jgi:outer membrane protein